MRSSAGSPAAASSMKRACGSLRGSAEYRPRWSVRITSASASTRLATSAPSVSLSPNLISSLTTVSFSLMTGMTFSAEQRQQRRARVQVALAVGQVGMRQQHLRAAQAVLAQLASRTSAPGPSGRPRRRPAVRAAPCGRVAQPSRFMPSAMAPLDTITSSRPCARQRGQLAAPVADGLGVDAAAFVGDQAGADLDDDAPRAARSASAHRRRPLGGVEARVGLGRPSSANCATCS